MFEGRDYLVSDAKYLKLDLPIPHEEMLKEAIKLREQFIPYRQDEYHHIGWHSLPIIGLSSKDPYAWNQYNYSSARDAAVDIKWTELAEQCPVTVNWLKTIYPSNSYGRVRFMLLEAGGNIGFHTDTHHSILGAVNIALNNPKGCKWLWRDEELEFQPGDAYTMNISYEHSIRNDSNEDRYHMIIHHYDSTREYKSLLKEALNKYEIQGNFHYSTELF
jgi:hypothetical protein